MNANVANYAIKAMLAANLDVTVKRLSLILSEENLECLANGFILSFKVKDEEAFKKFIQDQFPDKVILDIEKPWNRKNEICAYAKLEGDKYSQTVTLPKDAEWLEIEWA